MKENAHSQRDSWEGAPLGQTLQVVIKEEQREQQNGAKEQETGVKDERALFPGWIFLTTYVFVTTTSRRTTSTLFAYTHTTIWFKFKLPMPLGITLSSSDSIT